MRARSRYEEICRLIGKDPEQKLRESVRRQARRKKRSAVGGAHFIDATQYGDRVFLCCRRVCSAGWDGSDYVVHVPRELKSWRGWPADRVALSAMKRDHRGAAREISCAALARLQLEFDASRGYFPGLRDILHSVGCVRIAPKQFDEDTLIHSFHHYRDGLFDVLWGSRIDKRGKPYWLGSQKDTPQASVRCSYNQVDLGDVYGVRFVFGFKERL